MNATASPPPRASVTDAPRDRTEPLTRPSKATGRKGAVVDLLGLPHLVLGPLAVMDTAKNGQGQPNHVSVYALDMQTLAMHTEPLADAITELSDAYPTLGAFLDKIGQVTPFGALLTVGISMAFQFAENHGALSPTMRDTMPGVIPRDDLARAIVSNANNGNGEAA